MGRNLQAPKWIRAFLNSFSQVVFLENILSGAFVLMGIAVFSYEIADWSPILLAIIGAIVGNGSAKVLFNEEKKIVSGLYGFNPVLVGIAAATFFRGSEAYLITILGSILVTPLTKVINKLCSYLELPGFTLPFIITTWLFLLLSFQSNRINLKNASSASLALAKVLENGPINWKDALVKGIGEIYLLDTIPGSILILLAFVFDKWQLAIKILATALGTIMVGLMLKVDTRTLNLGLYSYNAILVYLGLETFSINNNKRNSLKFLALTIFAVVLACLVDYASPTLLGVYGLPTLTFPFVLVTWILLFFEGRQGPTS